MADGGVEAEVAHVGALAEASPSRGQQPASSQPAASQQPAYS